MYERVEEDAVVDPRAVTPEWMMVCDGRDQDLKLTPKGGGEE